MSAVDDAGSPASSVSSTGIKYQNVAKKSTTKSGLSNGSQAFRRSPSGSSLASVTSSRETSPEKKVSSGIVVNGQTRHMAESNKKLSLGTEIGGGVKNISNGATESGRKRPLNDEDEDNPAKQARMQIEYLEKKQEQMLQTVTADRSLSPIKATGDGDGPNGVVIHKHSKMSEKDSPSQKSDKDAEKLQVLDGNSVEKAESDQPTSHSNTEINFTKNNSDKDCAIDPDTDNKSDSEATGTSVHTDSTALTNIDKSISDCCTNSKGSHDVGEQHIPSPGSLHLNDHARNQMKEMLQSAVSKLELDSKTPAPKEQDSKHEEQSAKVSDISEQSSHPKADAKSPAKVLTDKGNLFENLFNMTTPPRPALSSLAQKPKVDEQVVEKTQDNKVEKCENSPKPTDSSDSDSGSREIKSSSNSSDRTSSKTTSSTEPISGLKQTDVNVDKGPIKSQGDEAVSAQIDNQTEKVRKSSEGGGEAKDLLDEDDDDLILLDDEDGDHDTSTCIVDDSILDDDCKKSDSSIINFDSSGDAKDSGNILNEKNVDTENPDISKDISEPCITTSSKEGQPEESTISESASSELKTTDKEDNNTKQFSSSSDETSETNSSQHSDNQTLDAPCPKTLENNELSATRNTENANSGPAETKSSENSCSKAVSEPELSDASKKCHDINNDTKDTNTGTSKTSEVDKLIETEKGDCIVLMDVSQPEDQTTAKDSCEQITDRINQGSPKSDIDVAKSNSNKEFVQNDKQSEKSAFSSTENSSDTMDTDQRIACKRRLSSSNSVDLDIKKSKIDDLPQDTNINIDNSLIKREISDCSVIGNSIFDKTQTNSSTTKQEIKTEDHKPQPVSQLGPDSKFRLDGKRSPIKAEEATTSCKNNVIKISKEGLEKIIQRRIDAVLASPSQSQTLSEMQTRIDFLNEQLTKWKNTAKEFQSRIIDITSLNRPDRKRGATKGPCRHVAIQVDENKVQAALNQQVTALKSAPQKVAPRHPGPPVIPTAVASSVPIPQSVVTTVSGSGQTLIVPVASASANGNVTLLAPSNLPPASANLSAARFKFPVQTSSTMVQQTCQQIQPKKTVRQMLNSRASESGDPSAAPAAAVIPASNSGVGVIDLTEDEEISPGKPSAPSTPITPNSASAAAGANPDMLLTSPPASGAPPGPANSNIRPGTYLVPVTSCQPILLQGVVNQQGPPGQGTTLVYTSTRPTGPTAQQQLVVPGANGQQIVTLAPGQNPSIRPGTQLIVTQQPLQAAKTAPPIKPNVSLQPAPAKTAPKPIQAKTSARHPAPLPPQPTCRKNLPDLKDMPPKPSLKISRVPQGIVLSWNMTSADTHAEIGNYQLFAYQEGIVPPSSALWKRVGDVKALPLPMACTLTQFQEGNKYHFAVRAVDTHSRIGPFSDPSSIHLESVGGTS